MNARRFVKPALVVLVVIALAVLARQLSSFVPAVVTWVEGLGVYGPLVFGLLYAVATVLFVPGSVLTLAAGALFGLVQGTVVVWLAAMAGSGAAFLIARYGARGWVQDSLGESRRFEAVDRAVGESGLKIAFLLRLSPVFPFNFLNYALGLTGVRFRDYMLAGFGMIPGTLLYVYYGEVIGTVAKLAADAETPRDTRYYVFMAIGLVATIAVTTIVTRIARRALGDVADAGGTAEAADAGGST